jgi:hypothetical protein
MHTDHLVSGITEELVAGTVDFHDVAIQIKDHQAIGGKVE